MSPVNKLFYSIFICAALALFTELLCRRLEPSHQEDPNIHLDFDANLMWGLSTSNLRAPDYRPNRLGLRGPELATTPTLRILTLGDSSIFGDEVRYEETFSTVVAQRLGTTARPVEPIIGAIPGYSTFQALRQLERLTPLAPQVVIIGALWSDAFATAVSDQRWQQELSDAYTAWRPVTDLLGALSDTSATARGLRRLIHAIGFAGRGDDHKISWTEYAAPAPDAPPTPPGVFVEPLTHRVPPDGYQANLRTLIAATRAIGARPVLLLLPHPLDDAGQPLPMAAALYRDIMREVAAEQAVPLVDTAAWFRQHPCGCSRFADGIHPNATGHAAMADAVIEALTPLLTPNGAP